jgi:hypothetical protein
MYCGKPLTGGRGREHIVPRWYLSERGITKKPVVVSHFDKDGNALARRPLVLDAFLAGRVCRACNSGWMSSLERAAQPVLRPLIAGTKLLGFLSAAETEIVSRWACKTVFALSDSTMGERRVPAHHARQLAFNRPGIPQELIIVGARSEFDVPFDFLEIPNWEFMDVPKPGKTGGHVDTSRSYKVAVQFGHLVLIVAYWTGGSYLYGVDEEMHTVLWAQRGKDVVYRRRPEPIILDASHFLHHSARSLGLVSDKVPSGIVRPYSLQPPQAP